MTDPIESTNERAMRLRYVADLNPTKSQVRHLDSETPVTFVPMEAVGEYGGIDVETEKPLSTVLDGYTHFRDGDVVVAKITPCFENGKGALASGLKNGIAFGTTELHVLHPRDDLQDRFLFYITMSDRFRRVGAADMYGAGGQKRISDDFIRNFVHWIPPIDHQIAISEFLDRETGKIDALVAKKEELMRLLQEKRTALITRAVTKGLDPNAPMKDSGIEWLGEIPAHWEVTKLAYRYEVQLGKMLDQSRITGESSYPYLRVFDVQWGEINTENLPVMDFSPSDQAKFRLKAGDLMVNEGGSYVGRSAVWNGELDDCFYQKALHRVRARSGRDSTRFLYYAMSFATRQGVFVAGGNQTTIDHLTAEQLNRYRFAFPPIEEQNAIATHLDQTERDLDRLVRRVEDAIAHLQELRTALISAAVTGKIDVREDSP
jgi:type I restriction enzyme S subunit